MKKYIDEYTEKFEKYIENPEPETIEKMKKEHLIKIQFIQHERIVHWFVTMLVGILLFISIAMLFSHPDKLVVLILVILLLGLEFPYLLYYYYIENATQKLYRLYDILCEKQDKLYSEEKNNHILK